MPCRSTLKLQTNSSKLLSSHRHHKVNFACVFCQWELWFSPLILQNFLTRIIKSTSVLCFLRGTTLLGVSSLFVDVSYPNAQLPILKISHMLCRAWIQHCGLVILSPCFGNAESPGSQPWETQKLPFTWCDSYLRWKNKYPPPLFLFSATQPPSSIL